MLTVLIKVVVRAVCCSADPAHDAGDAVITQKYSGGQ